MNQLLLNALNFATNISCNVNLHCISSCLEHDGQVYDRVLMVRFTGGILRDLVDPMLGSDRIKYNFREEKHGDVIEKQSEEAVYRYEENLEDDFSHPLRN